MFLFLKCDSLKDIIEKKFCVFIRNEYEKHLQEQKANEQEIWSTLPTGASSETNNRNASPSPLLFVIIDYLHLSDHFKLDLLMVSSKI